MEVIGAYSFLSLSKTAARSMSLIDGRNHFHFGTSPSEVYRMSRNHRLWVWTGYRRTCGDWSWSMKLWWRLMRIRVERLMPDKSFIDQHPTTPVLKGITWRDKAPTATDRYARLWEEWWSQLSGFCQIWRWHLKIDIKFEHKRRGDRTPGHKWRNRNPDPEYRNTAKRAPVFSFYLESRQFRGRNTVERSFSWTKYSPFLPQKWRFDPNNFERYSGVIKILFCSGVHRYLWNCRNFDESPIEMKSAPDFLPVMIKFYIKPPFWINYSP